MSPQLSSCDPSLLQRLLVGDLSDDEQTHVESHLDGCDSCCRSLEAMAAEESWWQEASDFLATNESAGDGANSSLIPSTPLSTVESTVGDIPLDFLDASDSPAMLGSLGGYDIIEPIGCGGMGVVLKGYDRELNRFVAVKVLAPHYATSAAARKRFAREAQAAAAVVHPHVLAIHSVDASGRLPYLVMPLVTGESLQQRIEREGSLSLEEILRIGSQAARGLQAAHDQGLVHRDIKPGNILLERGVERVMLTDFGLARAVDDASMTRSGVIAGTPQFMSPEQARGDSIDHRSDLFSLGSVLYTMAAGRPPFRAESTLGLLNRIVETEPRQLQELSPAIPVWLCSVIAKLHAKAPGDRFESAGELAELLEDCLAHVQQPMASALPAALPRQTLVRSGRRETARRGIIAAFLVVGIGVSAAAFPWPDQGESDRSADASFADSELVNEPEQPTLSQAELPVASLGDNASVAPSSESIEPFIPGSSDIGSPATMSVDGEIASELSSIQDAINVLDEQIVIPVETDLLTPTIELSSPAEPIPQSVNED
ncbi:MAG: protein kinase domain-containing protein [Planctomycetota bacterium]|jgi:serine/threonine-protein kinase